MQETFKSSLIYLVAGGGFSKVVSILLVFIVVNTFGSAIYGQYLLVIGVVSLFGTAYDLVSGQIYEVEIARLSGQNQWHRITSLRAQALKGTFIAVFGVMLFAVGFYFLQSHLQLDQYWPADILSTLVIATLISTSGGFKKILLGTNRGLRRFRKIAIWDTSENALRLSLALGAIYAGMVPHGTVVLLAIDWTALIAGLAIYGGFLRQSLPDEASAENLEPTPRLVELVYQNGLAFALKLVVVELTSNGRNWLISGAISFEMLGVYGVAKRITQSGKVLLPMGVLFNSYLAQLSHDGGLLREGYFSGMRASALISIVVMALLIVFAFFVPFFFSENTDTLQILIIIMSLIYPLKIVTYSVNSMLNVDRKYVAGLVSTLAAAISMVILAPLLIPWIGVYGVVVESIVSSLIGAFTAYIALMRYRPDLTILPRIGSKAPNELDENDQGSL